MRPALIADTGPLVAVLNRTDPHHHWARQQFDLSETPLLTCEPVLSETCFLLARDGLDPAKALELLERGSLRIAMTLAEEITAVRKLFQRYDNVPASLADACLIRMSELYEPCRVMTLDGDFQVYRRHGRQVIPLLTP